MLIMHQYITLGLTPVSPYKWKGNRKKYGPSSKSINTSMHPEYDQCVNKSFGLGAWPMLTEDLAISSSHRNKCILLMREKERDSTGCMHVRAADTDGLYVCINVCV